uniref:Uncharacterized protein n=1 Tax=Arion vulgaris TaxID=1028688 RepID=A0A0B6Y9M6_9EUPU
MTWRWEFKPEYKKTEREWIDLEKMVMDRRALKTLVADLCLPMDEEEDIL